MTRNVRISSWLMLFNLRLAKLTVKRERTNSQVLTVFFFGICSVILHVKTNCLQYFHDTPPAVLE